MKILVVAFGSPFPVYKDGATVRIYHLIKHLVPLAECRAVFLTNESPSASEREQARALCVSEFIEYRPLRAGYQTLHKILDMRRCYSEVLALKIKNICEEFKPDFVIAEQAVMAAYCTALMAKVRVISAVDSLSLAALRTSQLTRNPFDRFLYRILYWQRLAFEKKFLRQFDTITTVGINDATHLEKVLSRQVQVIPNGVDCSSFHRESTVASDKIAFSGNMSSKINYLAAEKLMGSIFPEVQRVVPSCTLTIVGRSPPEYLNEFVSENVSILPDVASVSDALKDSFIYVCPIEFGVGIRNSILQALAMAMPVVLHQQVAESIGILHGRTGYVAQSQEELKALTIKALLNKEEAIQIGRRGQEHVQRNYTWEAMAKKYVSIYESLTV